MFQATPASMANLMKKLETVDDEGGSSASNQSQPTTKHSRHNPSKSCHFIECISFLERKDIFWLVYAYCASALRAEEVETEASIIVEKLENEPKVSSKTNSTNASASFEDDTSNIKAAAVVVFLLLLS